MVSNPWSAAELGFSVFHHFVFANCIQLLPEDLLISDAGKLASNTWGSRAEIVKITTNTALPRKPSSLV